MALSSARCCTQKRPSGWRPTRCTACVVMPSGRTAARSIAPCVPALGVGDRQQFVAPAARQALLVQPLRQLGERVVVARRRAASRRRAGAQRQAGRRPCAAPARARSSRSPPCPASSSGSRGAQRRLRGALRAVRRQPMRCASIARRPLVSLRRAGRAGRPRRAPSRPARAPCRACCRPRRRPPRSRSSSTPSRLTLPPAASIRSLASSRLSVGSVPVSTKVLPASGLGAASAVALVLGPGDAGGAQLLDHLAVVRLVEEGADALRHDRADVVAPRAAARRSRP